MGEASGTVSVALSYQKLTIPQVRDLLTKVPFNMKVRAQRSRAAWQSGLFVTIFDYPDRALFKLVETSGMKKAILKSTRLQRHAEKHATES